MRYTDEPELLQRLSEGDESAFRTLFERYYPRIREFVGCIVKSDEIAEDIAQDTFVKVWERRDNFYLSDYKRSIAGGGIVSFGGYVYVTARNAALNALRRSGRVQDVAQIAARPGDSFENEYYAREIELLIRLVVSRMPSKRRRIFELSRYDGLDNGTIAKMMKISKKTVENQLSLALSELRHILALAAVLFLV